MSFRNRNRPIQRSGSQGAIPDQSTNKQRGVGPAASDQAPFEPPSLFSPWPERDEASDSPFRSSAQSSSIVLRERSLSDNEDRVDTAEVGGRDCLGQASSSEYSEVPEIEPSHSSGVTRVLSHGSQGDTQKVTQKVTQQGADSDAGQATLSRSQQKLPVSQETLKSNSELNHPPNSQPDMQTTEGHESPTNEPNQNGEKGPARPAIKPAYFRSRRLKKSEIQRPWLKKKDPRQKWTTILPIVGFLLGLCMVGLLFALAFKDLRTYRYCEVLNDDFSGWKDSVWTKEVEVGGFGNGQFEMTTDTEENVFIKEHVLWIKPTLQDPSLINDNHTMDLRNTTCTGRLFFDCVAQTNTTNGTIINPVKSGRIHTKRGAWIKYGRVEVTAQLPAGDWLWPAIWMLPVNNTYGIWPASGEIDIMESRGNNYKYKKGGNNIVSSTLHFGPNSEHDGWWRNNVKQQSPLHDTYADKYHTFGLEWSEKYIYTYLDNRLLQIMYTPFKEGMWKWGQFPLTDRFGHWLHNPWELTRNSASPFDQNFYLVLNLAVGGTNGWFEDGMANKPWIDKSPTAKKEFWNARSKWYPTWRDKGFMKVKSVKMWQQEGFNGCYV